MEAVKCPKCKSTNVFKKNKYYLKCTDCGTAWSMPRHTGNIPRMGGKGRVL